jgi:hypothetical protein
MKCFEAILNEAQAKKGTDLKLPKGNFFRYVSPSKIYFAIG